MKEDILEQLVDDYLQLEGFFTVHNVKFHPAKNDPEYAARQDAVHSDVDVVGIHPRRKGPKHICVVSCKAWVGGFSPTQWITWIDNNKRVMGRPAWCFFRELVIRKWADGLIRKIDDLTGSTKFTYVTAVTKLRGDRSRWQEHRLFKKNLHGNPIIILTLEEILTRIYQAQGTTPAPSEVGRLLQVIKAADWRPSDGSQSASPHWDTK